MKSVHSRGLRSKTARSCLKTVLPYTAPLFIVLAIVLLTAIYYVAIRSYNVELSFDQLSAFERQVSTIGNTSIYVVEPPRKDNVMASLSTQDWAKVSSHIDFVAFVYDDPFAILNPSFLSKVVKAFERMPLREYGIVLFSCGCVIPNKIFVNTQTRFNGAECTMFPGFVIANEDVAFIDTKEMVGRCKNRNAVLHDNWYETNAWKLEDARREHTLLREDISGKKGPLFDVPTKLSPR